MALPYRSEGTTSARQHGKTAMMEARLHQALEELLQEREAQVTAASSEQENPTQGLDSVLEQAWVAYETSQKTAIPAARPNHTLRESHKNLLGVVTERAHRVYGMSPGAIQEVVNCLLRLTPVGTLQLSGVGQFLYPSLDGYLEVHIQKSSLPQENTGILNLCTQEEPILAPAGEYLLLTVIPIDKMVDLYEKVILLLRTKPSVPRSLTAFFEFQKIPPSIEDWLDLRLNLIESLEKPIFSTEATRRYLENLLDQMIERAASETTETHGAANLYSSALSELWRQQVASLKTQWLMSQVISPSASPLKNIPSI